MNKTHDKIRWIAVFAVLLILTVFVVAANTNGFTDFNLYGWFTKQETSQSKANATDSENSFGLQIYNSKFMKLSASAMNAPVKAASNGITLTATILPDTATDKTVDWTVEFSNPSDSWAKGKNASDYVLVSPTSDGALTATVSAKKAFSSQIKITVTSRANVEATAYCLVEYGQRLSDTATMEFTNNQFATEKKLTNVGVQSIEAIKAANWQLMTQLYGTEFTYAPSYASDYTKANESATTTFSVKASDSLYNALKAKGIAKSSNSWVTLETKAIGKIYESLCTVQLIPVNGVSSEPISNVNKFNEAVLAATGSYDLELKITVKTAYETKDYVIQCLINRNGAAFAAKSVTLDTTTIVL